MITALQDVDGAVDAFQHFRTNRRLPVTVHAYNSLILLLANAGRADEALDIFGLLRMDADAVNLKPDHYTYRSSCIHTPPGATCLQCRDDEDCN